MLTWEFHFTKIGATNSGLSSPSANITSRDEEKFSISAVHRGSHQPHLAVEHLKGV